MLVNIDLPQPYVVGSEADLERIQNFRDALFAAVEKFEQKQIAKFFAWRAEGTTLEFDPEWELLWD